MMEYYKKLLQINYKMLTYTKKDVKGCVNLRFIGNKKDLLGEIDYVIKENIKDNSKQFLDLFAGTGSVGNYFKKDYEIISNDNLYFSYCIQKAIIENNLTPNFKRLKQIGIKDPLEYLVKENYIIDETYFIYHNYSPTNECERMYFSNENAARIDFIRQKIEEWKKNDLLLEDEYFYLLTTLILAVQKVANITGTYGAYLKKWDKRAFKKLELEPLLINNNNRDNKAYCKDINKLISEVKGDILYLDPPYNGRQYFSNYHVLETIARYDYPRIKGVTGLRANNEGRSKYSLKSKAYETLEDLISKANVNHLILSYSSDGILSKDEIEKILKNNGINSTYKVYEIEYRKYKSVHKQKEKKLFEYLFYIKLDRNKKHEKSEKKLNNIQLSMLKTNVKPIKSPLNYIGGKYDLLDQILPLFPKDINTFVDLFAGGFNVGINVDAKKILANDMNYFIIEFLNELKNKPIEEILNKIYFNIDKYNLSKENEEGFKKFRKDYNNNKNPIDLYTLVCYSFNYQFRFNNDLDYNNPFGRNRSQFSINMKKRLILFSERLKYQNVTFSSNYFEDIDLSSLNENDFVYCDPPYSITTGSYNDGNRGFKNWTQASDEALFKLLDSLNDRNIKFALSNVLEHKGEQNDLLIEWSKKYNIHYLNKDYSNSSYNTKKGTSKEVLITNY